jgi:hypothetical protein
VDSSFPAATRKDHERVADSLRRVIDDVFRHGNPPLRLPIRCRLGSPPRASLDSWSAPTEHLIDIDVPAQDRKYAQFVFQLAHEVGHVYVGVHRRNFAIETIVTALSFEALSGLARRWKVEPPYSYWSDYARCFREYRTYWEDDCIAKSPPEIRQAAIAHQWDSAIRGLWPYIGLINTSDEGLNNDQGRALQGVAAMALLAQPVVNWSDFIGIENFTVPGPDVSLEFMPAPFDCALIRANAPSILWLTEPPSTPL